MRDTTDIRALVPQTFDQFKVTSTDGLQFIPKSTMVHALQSLNLNPPISELRQAIDDADTNGDGAIDAQEFEAFVERYADTITDVGRCIDNFMELDNDKNGILDRDELRTCLRLAGTDALNDAEFNVMWDSIDVDRNGEISIEEFVLAMCPGATLEIIRQELGRRNLSHLASGPNVLAEQRKIEVEEIGNRNSTIEEWEKIFTDMTSQDSIDASVKNAKEREEKRIERERLKKEEDERKRKEAEEKKRLEAEKQQKAKSGCC